MTRVILDELARGDTPTYQLTVVRTDGTFPDLRLANTKIWFTAKRSAADPDAAAVVKKGTASTGLTGITIPADPPGNVAKVAITGADTSVLTETTRLVFDVQLEEPSGVRTTILHGVLPVVADITLA